MSMYPPYFQHVFDVIFSILAVQNQSFMLLDKHRNEALKIRWIEFHAVFKIV